ncbi:hypothetical protein JL720_12092 [Aureococcus anophagefferens]|nr:hypothetical protein JL720_12092 [Aureococcus anophagefferens]
MICEILDPRTQATIEQNTSVMGSSDFCQSNRLCAQVLAMISENAASSCCWTNCYPRRHVFYVHSAKDYVGADEALTFYDLAARCTRCNHEILIGYQDTESLETQINPRDKSTSKHWHGLDLVLLRGDSRLQGQDRTQVAETLIDDLAMVPAGGGASFNRIARIERPSFEAKNGRPSFSNPYGDESTPRY